MLCASTLLRSALGARTLPRRASPVTTILGISVEIQQRNSSMDNLVEIQQRNLATDNPVELQQRNSSLDNSVEPQQRNSLVGGVVEDILSKKSGMLSRLSCMLQDMAQIYNK
jgi:hypothetical protein